MSDLDKTFFAQVREAAELSRKHSKRQLLGQLLEARHELSKLQPPASLLEMLRLQNPERVRQDAAEPGNPKYQVVLDDGPNAGMTVAVCEYEYDAALMVAIWNWVRTVTPNDGSQRTGLSAPTTYDCNDSVTALSPVRCTDWLGRIVCGDNTEVLSGFPDACIDLVVTSPPYDDLRTYGGHSWNFETLAAQLVRVLKPGGVIVWVVADKTEDGSETGTSMRQALHFMDVCGLRLHDTMVYAKSNYVPLTHNRYEQAWEYCFVVSKGKPARWNPLTIPTAFAGAKKSRRGAKGSNGQSVRERAEFTIVSENRLRSNVWEYIVGHQKQVETGTHPAPMPDELAKDLVATWSNPGDVVLDPFSGSGTTCKAAKELNRQWCGIEINPEYCAIAQARLSQDVLQLETCAMRPNEPSSATRHGSEH